MGKCEQSLGISQHGRHEEITPSAFFPGTEALLGEAKIIKNSRGSQALLVRACQRGMRDWEWGMESLEGSMGFTGQELVMQKRDKDTLSMGHGIICVMYI